MYRLNRPRGRLSEKLSFLELQSFFYCVHVHVCRAPELYKYRAGGLRSSSIGSRGEYRPPELLYWVHGRVQGSGALILGAGESTGLQSSSIGSRREYRAPERNLLGAEVTIYSSGQRETRV